MLLAACSALGGLITLRTSAAELGSFFDFYKSYCGIITADGKNIYNIKYQTSAATAVKAGDKVTMAPVYAGQEQFLTVFDSKGKVLEQVSDFSKLTVLDSFDGDYHIVQYTMPEGATKVRVVCVAEAYRVFMASKNNAAFVKSAYLNAIQKTGLQEYFDFLFADKSAYEGKTLLWCGDSVGAGSYEHHYEGADLAGVTSKTGKPSWAGRTANLLGLSSYKNTSKGGSCYTTKHSAANIQTQVANGKGKYDILVMEGGNVDTGGYASKVVPIGYLSDSYDPSTFSPPETLMGGMELAFYNATTMYKDSVIVCIVPYRVPPNKNFVAAWERNYQYYSVVCEKWGIPIIDLYHNDATNEAIDYDSRSAGLFFYDNLHCTPFGYTVSTLEICMAMLNIGKYDEADRHMPDEVPYFITKEGSQEPQKGTQEDIVVPLPGNVYSFATQDSGIIAEDCKSLKDGEFVTSDWISVKEGDKVYFGPSSPYEVPHLVGYDDKKEPVTGQVNSFGVEPYGYFNSGRLIFEYTVPEGVSYVRACFSNTVVPVVTVNAPFTRDRYNLVVSAALEGRGWEYYVDTVILTGEQAPVITTPPVTPGTEPEGTAGQETENKKGCGGSAAVLSAAVTVCAAFAAYRRRKGE